MEIDRRLITRLTARERVAAERASWLPRAARHAKAASAKSWSAGSSLASIGAADELMAPLPPAVPQALLRDSCHLGW